MVVALKSQIGPYHHLREMQQPVLLWRCAPILRGDQIKSCSTYPPSFAYRAGTRHEAASCKPNLSKNESGSSMTPGIHRNILYIPDLVRFDQRKAAACDHCFSVVRIARLQSDSNRHCHPTPHTKRRTCSYGSVFSRTESSRTNICFAWTRLPILLIIESYSTWTPAARLHQQSCPANGVGFHGRLAKNMKAYGFWASGLLILDQAHKKILSIKGVSASVVVSSQLRTWPRNQLEPSPSCRMSRACRCSATLKV